MDPRLERMSRTPDEIAAAIPGRSHDVLTRRPDGKNWAANEIVCHLRDIEEVYLLRAKTILANDHEIAIYADPGAIDRMAEHRQYHRRHPQRGRLTIDFFVGMLATHDDNHLDQLRRALDGKA